MPAWFHTVRKNTCETCGSCYEFDGDLYCSYLRDSDGDSLQVSYNGTCKHYWERNTSGNSGYHVEGCFLTSACVSFLKKTDDCYELKTLRQFRDNYLSTSKQGRNLVKEYYNIAPLLVEKIEKSEHKEKYYNYIYDKIQKCLFCIENSKFKEAVTIYYDMVKHLQSAM